VGQLSRNWSGLAFVPWRDFYRIRGEIPGDVPPESIRRLKKLLGDIGIANLPNSPDYDPATRAAVMAFQRRYGIEPDGIVGPATKIVLYNALDTLTTPGLATGSDSLASVDAQGGTQ